MKEFNLFRNGKQVEETAVHGLHKPLSVAEYTHYPYEKLSLDEDMYVIN